MNFLAALRSALRALAANTLRSILTMLGIIIGVAAVITMIAVGQGATNRVQEQMKGLAGQVAAKKFFVRTHFVVACRSESCILRVRVRFTVATRARIV